MTDLAVIILTKDERLHIRRCLERLMPLEPRQIFIVDCFSTDGTQEIVEKFQRVKVPTCESFKEEEPSNSQTSKRSNLAIVEHEWPGNQATQFNWALDNLKINASWILRIDADEYLLPELVDEIRKRLPSIPADVDGVILKRRHYFAGGWAKHGTYPVKILRLFRTGHGRYDDHMMMDERILVQGKEKEFSNDFVDHSLISMAAWRAKHRDYAKREARQAIDSLRGNSWADHRKASYYKLPPYFRAFAYFCVRYFLKGGILDGYAGWMWNFWQGLWYRCLVDWEIGKLKRA